MAKLIEDKDWVKNSLMLIQYQQEDPETGEVQAMIPALAGSRRIYSSAYMKYTDTTLGGNFAINPPPQFTRNADIKAGRGAQSLRMNESLFNTGSGGVGDMTRTFGMGRRYSEVIDDNSQLVHLRFGVPEFNSLQRFFTSFYDHEAAHLSRTGREPGFFYSLGRVSGFVVSAPVLPLVAAAHVYRFLTKKNTAKFYFLKPTMPIYWQAVNTMANNLAVNMGIIPRVLGGGDGLPTETGNKTTSGSGIDISGGEGGEESGEGEGAQTPQGAAEQSAARKYDVNAIEDMDPDEQYTSADIRQYQRLLPRIFRESGGVDIYAVANRAQRIAHQVKEKQFQEYENFSTFEQLQSRMREYVQEVQQFGEGVGYTGTKFSDANGKDGFLAYQEAFQKQKPFKAEKTEEGKESGAVEDAVENIKSWGEEFFDFSAAELADGGQFVTFRVNHTGTISESFSNETGPSEIQESLNGTSASIRSKRFSFADGNFIEGSPLAGIKNAITDFASGALDQLGVSGLLAVAGNAYADIPHVWQDSSVNLPQSSYDIQLRTPYGNKMSRFMNLYVPLCMLLAGALPKSTGKHSYDSPFLVELYDQGRSQVRLGMIDSLTVTRGVGNVGWTQSNEALGIDVQFSVVDLSSIMHMPLSTSPGVFDEDTAYTDYLAALGNLTLTDQIYQLRKLKLNLTKVAESWRSWSSPANWGMWPTGGISGRALTRITK